MSKIQSQGLHHITMVGSNREETIAFYEDVLGMRLVLEQPNLDVPEDTHLFFDMGDGRLLTFFVRASGSRLSIVDWTIGASSTNPRSMVSVPARTRDTSSKSSISFDCNTAFRLIVSSAFLTRSGSNCWSSNRRDHPRMAFSGVRSSCDTIARN